MDNSVLIAATVAFLVKKSRNKKRKRRTIWVKDWLKQRYRNGAYNNLIKELRLSDVIRFKNFARMDMSNFNKILCLVAPEITHQHTPFRDAISPGERLAVTLRYLATGK